jgi:hypothetical protein
MKYLQPTPFTVNDPVATPAYREGWERTFGREAILEEKYPLINFDDDCCKSKPNPDPIRHYKGTKKGWFYWDEDWIVLYGPFESYEECYASLVAYAKKL